MTEGWYYRTEFCSTIRFELYSDYVVLHYMTIEITGSVMS